MIHYEKHNTDFLKSKIIIPLLTVIVDSTTLSSAVRSTTQPITGIEIAVIESFVPSGSFHEHTRVVIDFNHTFS